MSTPRFIVGSVEYLKVQVVADSTLADTESVDIKLNGDWVAAEWTGDAGTTRIARTLVDFADVPPGNHNIYVRLTDTPESPILAAGRIKVEAESA